MLSCGAIAALVEVWCYEMTRPYLVQAPFDSDCIAYSCDPSILRPCSGQAWGSG